VYRKPLWLGSIPQYMRLKSFVPNGELFSTPAATSPERCGCNLGRLLPMTSYRCGKLPGISLISLWRGHNRFRYSRALHSSNERYNAAKARLLKDYQVF
jgi:hypothetical protein